MADAGFRHLLAALAFAGLVVYWATSDFFGTEIVSEIAVFAILAMSLDLAAGYAGLISLAHGALLGFGAYMYAHFAVTLEVSPPIAIVIAVLLSALLSLAIGFIVSRVHGIFFIMATLALGEMGYEYFFKSRIFGGDDGFAGIPRIDLDWVGIDSGDPGSFALVLIALAAVVYLMIAWLLRSPYGWALVGLHQNEARMRALGLPTRLYRASVFAVSGAVAGFAGTLTAMHIQFITPQLLHWTTSGEALIMVILGGLGTLVGPVVGAALVVLLRHQLSSYTDYWSFWLGLFLIAIVLSRGNGIVGWLELGRDALWSRRRPAEPAAEGGTGAAR